MSLPTQISNIVVYGNSPKFIRLINNLYPDAKVTILPWRTSDSSAPKILATRSTPTDLLLICGYDYRSYHDTKKDYLHKNVHQVVSMCKQITNGKTKIVYIDTLDSSKHYTFSRYLFAKKMLAQELSASYPMTRILAIPTVYDEKNGICMQGGVLSRIAAKLLIRRGLIQTINLKQLQNQLKSVIESPGSNMPFLLKIHPMLISIPRTQFIDRLLRMALG